MPGSSFIPTSLGHEDNLEGLGSNPGEGMDVCKCIVLSRHGGTLNSRRAASPLMRLVEGEKRWEANDHSPKIGVEPSKIALTPAWCSRLRPTTGVHVTP
ncbi:uncharacterized protein TNCV_324381 [Trichonephila clavipes]|nr:uncharacterized protein TNCV_324381 [Trichonephila clavipes]